jgi:uncharacterized protein involved in outer membrane biogenesis
VRWTAFGLGSLVFVLAIVAVIGIAMFPFGMFRERVEGKLSERFGSKVTIAAIDRIEGFSFHPTIVLRDIRVPQPAWAGPGDLARIASVQVKLDALPILIGNFHPRGLAISGAELSLFRDAGGRKNYAREKKDEGRKNRAPPLTGLTVANSRITYRDLKRDRSFAVAFASDAAHGIRLSGPGQVQGVPVQIDASGPAVEGLGGKPWPFRASVVGRTLNLAATGTMEAPLDTGHMALDMVARGDNLKTIDQVIEAGLFDTQPVRLTGHVVHDENTWTVTRLAGTIGRSRIVGDVTVVKADGRSHIKGSLVSSALDFNDFSSDAGQARGAAKKRALGPRIIPDTKVDLTHLDHTDGVIDFRATRLLFDNHQPFETMQGKVTLDHQLLTVKPLTIGLTQGRVTGSAVSDQRGGVRVPMVTLDLALSGSRISTFGGAGVIDAPVRGWLKLAGRGRTIRDAVGRSSGTIALFAGAGTIPARAASLMGLDIGRGVLTDKGDVAGLRCMAIRLDASGGVARTNPILIDTTRSQARVTGLLRLNDETVAMELKGAPKQKSVLRLDRPVGVNGNFQSPTLSPPPDIASAGSIFRMIGNAIRGHQGALAQDVDCAALAARTLRR